MTSDFKEVLAEIRAQQEELREKAQAAKQDAIEHVQEIIDAFNIKPMDLHFRSGIGETAVKTRKPAAIKYRLPNGVEWTGKGRMKKEVQTFLTANNMTEDDLDQFIVPEYNKK